MTALVRRGTWSSDELDTLEASIEAARAQRLLARRRSPERHARGTAGLSVLKVTLAAALGLLGVRVSNRAAASVRHAILAVTFAAFRRSHRRVDCAAARRHSRARFLARPRSFTGRRATPRETAAPAAPRRDQLAPRMVDAAPGNLGVGTALCLLPPLAPSCRLVAYVVADERCRMPGAWRERA